MLLAHRKRKGYIIEKGLFGREKKIEQEYLYEKHLGLTPLADNVLGKALGVGTTHIHFVGKIRYANVVEGHHDAAGYDALVAIGKEIIKRVTGTHAPVETTLHILQSFGKENDREFVKAFDPDDPKLENHHQHILVYYPKYEDFYRNHKEEFANRATESIERIIGRKLTSEERQKLKRAFELAVEYGKRFHVMFRGIDENRYHMVAESAKVHRTEGFKAIEYAEKTLGGDFLEKVGDIILELNKLFPGFSKPEEVYGDRWYEFLKKRGIRPEELVPKPEKHIAEKSTPNLPSDALLEVLSILQALEFADYSENAKEKALQKLSSAVKELSRKDPTPENLLKLGLYAYAAELIKRNDFEKVRELEALKAP